MIEIENFEIDGQLAWIQYFFFNHIIINYYLFMVEKKLAAGHAESELINLFIC